MHHNPNAMVQIIRGISTNWNSVSAPGLLGMNILLTSEIVTDHERHAFVTVDVLKLVPCVVETIASHYRSVAYEIDA